MPSGTILQYNRRIPDAMLVNPNEDCSLDDIVSVLCEVKLPGYAVFVCNPTIFLTKWIR